MKSYIVEFGLLFMDLVNISVAVESMFLIIDGSHKSLETSDPSFYFDQEKKEGHWPGKG